jgi:uncharacterized membrane protein YedE/YeeE
MAIVAQLLAGLVFGLGLVISGMVNPAKVQNFLDIFGQWDPSLAFVMGGAVVVAFVGFRLTLRRARPVLAARFDLPTRRDIDARVIVGPAIFGVGWGLAGLCPGPALASLTTGGAAALVFVAAMAVGMWGARRLAERAPAAAAA